MRTKQREIIENLENFDYKLFGSNVLGIGCGLKEVDGKITNDLCVKFYVKKKIDASSLSESQLIPSKLNLTYLNEPIVTDVVESEFELLACGDVGNPEQNGAANRQKHRPIKGGISAINATDTSTGCTLGFIARDQYDGNAVGVTNLHCVFFANRSDHNFDGQSNSTVMGNQVINPSPADGGSIDSDDTIGYVKRIVPWTSSSKIYADVAIYALKQSVVGTGSDEFFGLPFEAPFLFATTEEIDEAISQKYILHSSGRTTGPKSRAADPALQITGFISSVSVSDRVNLYEFGDLLEIKWVNTDGSICSNPPILGGDSGSCLLATINGEVKIIGLIFAGNNSSLGLACRIDRIREEACIGQFGIKIDDNWIRTDIKDGFATDPKQGYTKFEYIVEPDQQRVKAQPSQKVKTAASLRTSKGDKKIYSNFSFVGQTSDGSFKTPKSQTDITGYFVEETGSLISKYVTCGEDIDGDANAGGFNPGLIPPVFPPSIANNGTNDNWRLEY